MRTPEFVDIGYTLMRFLQAIPQGPNLKLMSRWCAVKASSMTRMELGYAGRNVGHLGVYHYL